MSDEKNAQDWMLDAISFQTERLPTYGQSLSANTRCQVSESFWATMSRAWAPSGALPATIQCGNVGIDPLSPDPELWHDFALSLISGAVMASQLAVVGDTGVLRTWMELHGWKLDANQNVWFAPHAKPVAPDPSPRDEQNAAVGRAIAKGV